MSILINTVNEKTEEQLNNLGNVSTKLKESGAHLMTITSAKEISNNDYSYFVLEATTKSGETLTHMEFFGKPKDQSQEEIDKAQAKTDRTTAAIARIAKGIGYKNLKQAIAGAVQTTDEKGRQVTEFKAFENKQVTFCTTTEIQPDKEGTKAYANQVLDTFKILDKSGKDALGRDRLEAFDEECKNTIAIQWGKEQNPACVQLLNKMKEQALGVAPAATPTTPSQVTPPAQQAANVAAAVDDI